MIDDLVVSFDNVSDCGLTAFSTELTELIDIQGNELLNFEDIDSIPQSNIVRQPFSYR